MNNVVLCLSETQLMSWDAIFPYLSAKAEKRRLEVYQMDLLWLIAKRWYPNLQQPSDIENQKPRDTRSASQIKSDIYKRLGGGK